MDRRRVDFPACSRWRANQTHFVMVRGVCAARKRQAMAIHNRHDFQAFSTLRRADFRTAALGHRKGLFHPARVGREVLATCVKT